MSQCPPPPKYTTVPLESYINNITLNNSLTLSHFSILHQHFREYVENTTPVGNIRPLGKIRSPWKISTFWKKKFF